MSDNLAYKEKPREELLDGKIYMMSSPSINHNRVASHIFNAFYNYLKDKTCEAFSDSVDVHLTENDCVIPDVMIICNKDIIKPNGIYGTPDLIVEVMSPSTAKNDRGYKKNLYEKTGVKEYWIADPFTRSIETYLFSDGKYVLEDIYAVFPAGFGITDKEREESKKIIPVSLYDNFSIPLEEIFSNLF